MNCPLIGRAEYLPLHLIILLISASIMSAVGRRKIYEAEIEEEEEEIVEVSSVYYIIQNYTKYLPINSVVMIMSAMHFASRAVAFVLCECRTATPLTTSNDATPSPSPLTRVIEKSS